MVIMSQEKEAGSPRVGVLKFALWGAALVGAAVVVYIISQAFITPRAKGGLKDLTRGEMSRLVLPAEASAAPATSFLDADGKPVRIGDFRGKVVVVNLWATWCGPCKVEMPTLGKLQAHYPDKSALLVAAVSVDKNDDLNLAKAEIAANAPLTLFRDPGYKLAFSLKPRAEGFPTTLIIDRQGRERARMSGPADWNAPEVKALLDRLLRES